MATVEEMWAQYEKQIAVKQAELEQINYATIYAGFREGKDPPPYSASFGPFYVASSEISAFATELNGLISSAVGVTNTLSELTSYISSNLSDISIPTPTFDINTIIPEFTASFSLINAATGRCSLAENLPTTVLGAVQNTVKAVIGGIADSVVNFLDKVNYMFAAPAKMVNNLMRWLDDSTEQIKAPLADERSKLMNKVRELREDCKQKNDPTMVVDIITQMNLVGSLDRKVRDLIAIMNRLRDQVSMLLIHMENCMIIGVALARNVNNAIAAWSKDMTCIQAKFKTLIQMRAV